MNTALRTTITALILLTGISTGFAQDANSPKLPLAKLKLKSGDSIVFLGDSITHQCLYTQYVEDFFYTRYPKLNLKIRNAGVGGAKAWDALQRFDLDVKAYNPKYVMILLGMNDGQYQPFDSGIFETYQTDMTALIDKVKLIKKATPILMAPTMYDSRAGRAMAKLRQRTKEARELYNSVLAYYGSWLREIAVEGGHGFVDMYSPLNNLTLAERKRDANFTLIKDAIHPDAPGQVVMAFVIIQDLGLQAPLSNIKLVLDANGKLAEKKVSGGKLANWKSTGSSVEFTWTADSLPWVLPEEAQQGVALTKLAHLANREALEIDGLPPGSYELSIKGDGIAAYEVGPYDSTVLARQIELQSNHKTPQYQQALNVAELNKERNVEIKKIRDGWRVAQAWARKAEQFKSTPDDAKLKEDVEGLKLKWATAKKAAIGFQTKADELEAKIRKINQPKSLKYSLKRVPSISPAVLVVGTITMGGKPMADAKLEFHGSHGDKDEVTTDEAGRFFLNSKKLPSGTYTLTVNKSDVDSGQYGTLDTSPLKYNITPGRSEISIKLKMD